MCLCVNNVCLCTVKLLNNGHIRIFLSVLCSEVVRITLGSGRYVRMCNHALTQTLHSEIPNETLETASL